MIISSFHFFFGGITVEKANSILFWIGWVVLPLFLVLCSMFFYRKMAKAKRANSDSEKIRALDRYCKSISAASTIKDFEDNTLVIGVPINMGDFPASFIKAYQNIINSGGDIVFLRDTYNIDIFEYIVCTGTKEQILKITIRLQNGEILRNAVVNEKYHYKVEKVLRSASQLNIS